MNVRLKTFLTTASTKNHTALSQKWIIQSKPNDSEQKKGQPVVDPFILALAFVAVAGLEPATFGL